MDTKLKVGTRDIIYTQANLKWILRLKVNIRSILEAESNLTDDLSKKDDFALYLMALSKNVDIKILFLCQIVFLESLYTHAKFQKDTNQDHTMFDFLHHYL